MLVRGDDVFSDDVPVGDIVSQNPAAGATLDRDGTVTVQVSKGPDKVAFPDLEGLSFSDAQQVLIDNGLSVGSLLGTTEGTFVEATSTASTSSRVTCCDVAGRST